MPVFEIPRLGPMVRHALPRVLEGTVIPFAIFLLVLKLGGFVPAVFAGLAWTYAAAFRHVQGGRRVPGLLVLALTTMTARAIVAAATGSAVLYFIQPTIGTALVGSAYLLSVAIGRPLAGKLASDFCPIDPDLLSNPVVRTFFLRVSLLWALVYLGNAAVTTWLLFTQPIVVYVAIRSVLGMVLTAAAIVVSIVWFRWSMRRNGIAVRLAPKMPALVPVPS